MNSILIIVYSTSGKTEEMGNFIAEGVRFTGNIAIVKRISEISDFVDIKKYDGYIIGSPTISLDIPRPVRAFLNTLKTVELGNKLAGAFGPYLHDASYRHDEHAPVLIFAFLEKELKLKPFSLGALSLKEEAINSREGIKACQEYGRNFSKELI